MGDLKIKLKLFRCRECNRHFTSANALSNHMHFHTRRPKHPSSSSSDGDDRAPTKGKALADLGPDPPRPTPEECAAWNLMFLARDSWERSSGSGSGSGNWPMQVRRARTQHVCGTCGKAFRSHQSLGGHRAGHVKAMADQPRPGPGL